MTKAKIVYPKKRFILCRDPKDNMLLECCFESKAHILISGDKDLLSIKDLPFKLKILTPRKFMDKV